MNERLYEKLKNMTKNELFEISKKLKIKGVSNLKKEDLIKIILQDKSESDIEKIINPSFWNKNKNSIYGWASLLGLLITLYGLFPNIEFWNEAEQIVCDRDTDLGCYLDFPEDKFTSDNNVILGHDQRGEYKPGKFITLLSGGNIMTYGGVDKTKSKYKLAFDVPESPFSVSYIDDKLNFYGEIIDIENDNEVIGWFTGNEFGINKPCAYSWNKDNKGVEIIDNRGRVCFSVDLIPKRELHEKINRRGKDLAIKLASQYAIEFRGYFKKDSLYYIFNDELRQTTNLIEAKEYISEIEKKFIHYGKNSLGKRKEN